MAKKIKDFSTSPSDFKETRLRPGEAVKPTHNDTHKHTHNDVYEPEQKEGKKGRIQFLTYESLLERLDTYATKRGVKKVAVFEAAMTAYLDMVDPLEEE